MLTLGLFFNGILARYSLITKTRNKRTLYSLYVCCVQFQKNKMTDYRKEEYFKKIYENIAKDGFHTTYVMEELNFTPFGYSTGIFENFKIPELFISGLPNGLTTGLTKNYAERYKFGTVPLNEKIEDLFERFPVYFIEVENESLTDYVLTSKKHYGNKEFRYLQLIFPDLNGNFPNELNYDYDQEILGNVS